MDCFRHLLLRDDGDEVQVGIRVVDEAVGVTLGAIVAEAGMDRGFLSVHNHRAAAGSDEYDFAAVLMGVHSDGGAWNQGRLHDAVGPVKEHSGAEFFLSALEIGNDGQFRLVKVYVHELMELIHYGVSDTVLLIRMSGNYIDVSNSFRKRMSFSK